MDNNKREHYIAPSTDVVEIHTEGMVCESNLTKIAILSSAIPNDNAIMDITYDQVNW